MNSKPNLPETLARCAERNRTTTGVIRVLDREGNLRRECTIYTGDAPDLTEALTKPAKREGTILRTYGNTVEVRAHG